MEEPERAKREKERPDLWSSPYPYLGLGSGFAVGAMMVIATTGVLVSGIGFVISAAVLLSVGAYQFQSQRSALLTPASKERELLSAIRDRGSITPAEAAMETSLTVRKADAMLSELAAGGHLVVESKKGALFYSLAGRGHLELGGRTER